MAEIVSIRFGALGEEDETRLGTFEGSANDESFCRHVASRGGMARGK